MWQVFFADNVQEEYKREVKEAYIVNLNLLRAISSLCNVQL